MNKQTDYQQIKKLIFEGDYQAGNEHANFVTIMGITTYNIFIFFKNIIKFALRY